MVGAITSQGRGRGHSALHVLSVCLVLRVFTRDASETEFVEQLFDTLSDDVGFVDDPTPFHAEPQACGLHSLVEALGDPVGPSDQRILGGYLVSCCGCHSPTLRRPLRWRLPLLWRSCSG
uniref:Uncharacterized protein n=1 Tax=Rhodococcus sp. Mel TaxID=1093626 RepID=H8ZKU8_9NOCA|nr:hypothetical protein [Rhodococcus sp. Mel]